MKVLSRFKVGVVISAVLFVCFLGTTRTVNAQEAKPSEAQAAIVLDPTQVPNSIEELVTTAEAAKSRLDSVVSHLYQRMRQALDLRRNLPAVAAPEAGVSGSSAIARDVREEQLTLQAAQLREYKRVLISIYDLITDEVDATGSSINWNLRHFESAVSRIDALVAEGAAAPAALEARVSALRNAREFLLSKLPLRTGSATMFLWPEGFFLDPGQLSGTRQLLAEDSKRHAPSIFTAPVDTLPADGRFVVTFNRDLLQRLQAAIDPVEKAEFSLEHEYLQLAASRLLELDQSGTTPPVEIEADRDSVSEPARIARQIERRQRYRESLLADFRAATLRYLRQLNAIGSEDALAVTLDLVSAREVGRGLSSKTERELEKIVREVIDDLAKPTHAPPSATALQLQQELAAWEETHETLSRQLLSIGADSKARPAIELQRYLLAMQLSGKQLRLANLEESMSRELALLQVARARVIGTAQSIVTIDDRITSLDGQWNDSALRFYAWAAAKVLVILLAAWLLIRIVKIVVNRVVVTLTDKITAEAGEEDPTRIRELTSRAKTLAGVFMTTVRVVVWVTCGLMVLGQFEVNYQPLLLATGGVTLAIGFGAQSLVKDFFSGFFILLENQFQVGDVVSINGTSGGVEAVTLRTTRLRSVDGSLFIVPNGEIKAVTNQTHTWSRISVNIGVGYGEDPDEIRDYINAVGVEMLSDPEWSSKLLEAPTVVGLDNFGASSLEFRVMARTRPGEQWAATRELRRRIKIAFDVHGVEIPFNYVNYVDAKPGESKVLRNRRKRLEESGSASESARTRSAIENIRTPDGG